MAQSSLVRIQQKLAAWSVVSFALASPLSLCMAQSAQAQTPLSEETSIPTTPAATEAPAAPQETEALPAADLNSYTYHDLFSVGLPNGWQVTEQETSPQVLATNINEDAPDTEASPAAIRTEITWFDAPPGEVVPQALQAIQEKGYTVSRYDAGMIDGTTALRIWLTDLPDSLPNAYMTYIGYDETTAAIISYYDAALPAVDTLIHEIHGSFQRLSEQR